jgi:hypothetical protein
MQKIHDEEGDAFPFEKARIIAGKRFLVACGATGLWVLMG